MLMKCALYIHLSNTWSSDYFNIFLEIKTRIFVFIPLDPADVQLELTIILDVHNVCETKYTCVSSVEQIATRLL